MHGTVVMLMALSGLGCHFKHADVAYVPSCYSSTISDGCYSDSCYSGCYSSVQPAYVNSCYSSADYIGGCYSESCYSSAWSSCYSQPKHCFLKRLFHGGLFKKHHRKYYDAPIETSCYSSCYSSAYEPAVFGTSMPIYETPWASSQVLTAPSKSVYTAPAAAPAAAAPAAAPATAPAAAPAADEPRPAPVDETSAPSISPPPPPAPASAVEDAVNSIVPAAPNAQP